MSRFLPARRLIPLTALALLAVSAPGDAAAQKSAGGRPRWKDIGVTGNGNPVQLDERSVRAEGGITTATLRVAFVKPVKSPKGPLTSARTIAMFDCARRQVAVKENWYYHDEKANRVYEHKVVAQPGWSTTIGGSMPAVALDHFCKR